MLPIVAVCLALIVYRIQTETGQLVIEPWPAKVISPRTQTILDRLEQTIPINFADETPLDDVLTYIKAATYKVTKPTDPGLPIYVDPLVERALTSKVRIDLNDAPLRLTLSLLLDQVGLAYLVKDDVLIISSPQGIDRERNETASPAERRNATDQTGAGQTRRAHLDGLRQSDFAGRRAQLHQASDHQQRRRRWHPHFQRPARPPGSRLFADLDREHPPGWRAT